MSETITKTSAEAENPGENPDASKWNMRVEDGNNILNDLKSKAKSGFGNVLKRTKEAGLVGLSLGYEGAGKAKEALGKAGQMAKEKASELFAQGKEAMIDAKAKAVARKAERITKRETNKQARADRRETRQSDKQEIRAMAESNRETRQELNDDMQRQESAQNTADVQAEAIVARATEIAKQAEQEQALLEKEKAEKEKKLLELTAIATSRSKEAEELEEKAKENPDDHELQAAATRAGMVRDIANHDVKEMTRIIDTLTEKSKSLEAKINRAETTAEGALERIANRKKQAEQRKANRQAMKREARGELFSTAKDRLSNLTTDSGLLFRKIGRSVGRKAKGVASSLMSGARRAGSALRAGADGFREGWSSASGSVDSAKITPEV